MKRRTAVALLVILAASSMLAQRGGAHGGGVAMHAAPSFHSSPAPAFRSAPSFHYSGNPHPMPAAPMANRFASARPGTASPTHYPYRPPYAGHPGYPVHHPLPPNYHHTYVYSYSAYPLLSGYYGYSPFYGLPYYDDDSGAASAYATAPDSYPEPSSGSPAPSAGYDDGYAQPQPAPAYAPQPVGPTAEPSPNPPVILIFKDGRAPQQIQNYIASSVNIFVFEGPRHSDIRVADLDIAATVEANRQAGIDFQLPVTTVRN